MIACKMQDKMLVPARGTLMLPTPTPHPKVDWSSKMFLMIWKCLVASAIVSKRSDIDNDADLFAKFATLEGQSEKSLEVAATAAVATHLGVKETCAAETSRSTPVQRGPSWLRMAGLQYRGILSPPCTQALWDSRKSLARRPKPNVKICQTMSTCLNMFVYFWIFWIHLTLLNTFECVFHFLTTWEEFSSHSPFSAASHQGSAPVSCRPPSEDAGWNGMKRDDMIKTLRVAIRDATSISWKATEKIKKTDEHNWKFFKYRGYIFCKCCNLLPERKELIAVRRRHLPWLQAGVSKNTLGCRFWFKEGSYHMYFHCCHCQHIIWS